MFNFASKPVAAASMGEVVCNTSEVPYTLSSGVCHSFVFFSCASEQLRYLVPLPVTPRLNFLGSSGELFAVKSLGLWFPSPLWTLK